MELCALIKRWTDESFIVPCQKSLELGVILLEDDRQNVIIEGLNLIDKLLSGVNK